jgi:5-formyltetrahydrofolate cyclo-ligase
MPRVYPQFSPEAAADVKAQKRALRLSMNAIRNALSPEHRARAAEVLAQKADHPAFRAFLPPPGSFISGFIAIRSEIDPLPLLRRLLAEGYQIALPQLEGGGMVFRHWQVGDRLAEGPMQTREPLASMPEVTPSLILTPLLAFDPKSARLGYGMGYYDRYFSQNPDVPRVGLAFACQEVASVPCAPHDMLLNAVFTES